jgi:hypothetical protein
MTANKTPLSVALLGLLGTSALTAQASHLLLQNGDRLTIDAGQAIVDQFGTPVDVTSGSYFAFDQNGDSKIQGNEKVPITMGTTGFIVGLTSIPGKIDVPWTFNGGGQGQDYITIPFSPLAAGMDMSGWTITSDIFSYPMGTGAWTPTNCVALGCTGVSFADGIGDLTWSGVYGDAFTLHYTATAPFDLAQLIEVSRYYLHVEGVVSQVPVPAAAWLFGSGLLGLLGVAQRKRTGL